MSDTDGVIALTPEQARQALAAIRLTTGGLAALAPRTLGRVFGIRPEDNLAGPFLGRMYVFRNLALGAALVQRGDHDAQLLRWAVAIDVADAAAGLTGRLRGYLSKRTTVMAMGVALTAAALGAIARRDT